MDDLGVFSLFSVSNPIYFPSLNPSQSDPVENLRMFSTYDSRYRNQKVHVLIQLAGEWVSGFGFGVSVTAFFSSEPHVALGGEAALELWNRCLGCVDIVFLLPLQEDSCHESWWSFCRFETYFFWNFRWQDWRLLQFSKYPKIWRSS